MKLWKIFLLVCIGAFFGMIYGGLFGYIAGNIATDFFLKRSGEWHPVGLATFLGARAGVWLGGGLTCFSILVHSFLQWKKRDADAAAEPEK